MRIAMVSEHASPLAALGGADAGGQNVHVLELATALAGRGHEVTVWTRRDDPDLPDARHAAPRRGRCAHVTAGPARPVPRTSSCPTCPRSAAGWRAWARRAARRRARALLDVRARRGVRARAPLDLPVVQTFHALGSVKRRHQGARRHQPARPGRAPSGRVARRVDRVIATCTDEVFELARLGAPRHRAHRGALRRRHAPRSPRTARSPTRERAAAAGQRRAARPAQGRRRGRSPRCAAAGGRAASSPAGPAADARRDPDARRLRGWPRGAGSRTGSASSGRSPARRCRRCCARPTRSSACPGTSRSGSCRSRPWPAGARWSPARSAASRTPSWTGSPACSCRRAGPTRWRRRCGGLLGDPTRALRVRHRGPATACWPATAGTASPPPRARVYQDVLCERAPVRGRAGAAGGTTSGASLRAVLDAARASAERAQRGRR